MSGAEPIATPPDVDMGPAPGRLPDDTGSGLGLSAERQAAGADRRPRGGSRRALLAAGAVLAAALVAAVLVDSGPPPDGARRPAQPVTEYPPAERGEPVALRGTDLSGSPVDVGALRGGPVVLNVWGSWCAPCRTEAPVLDAVSEQYADRGVRFVGINVKDNASAARAFERRFGIGYPSLDDQTGRATLALNDYLPASVVPATLVLDPRGRVAGRILGAVEESTLRALLDEAAAS